MTERGDWTWKIEHGFGHGRWWWWRRTTVMNKKRRRKGARPESAKKKDWNWIELLQWGNSTLFGSCAAVQFCPVRRIRIIHRPLFGVLSLLRPFCRHVEQFKKRLSFASSSPHPRVHAYLLRSIQFVIICFYHSLAPLFSVCFIVKCL